MKYPRIVLIMMLALALTSVLPVMAQDETTAVEYVFNGTELQKIENGVIAQVWSLTNTLETQQIAGIMQAQAQNNDPAIRYEFDYDRMYLLRSDQVVGMWELRNGSWLDQPALIVTYNYDGYIARRFVNGRLQEEWTPIIGSYQWVASMQAQANELVAAHVNEEIHVEPVIEHLPTLLADNFTVHYKPAGESVDMSWYTPEFGQSLMSALAVDSNDPVVMAMENLVVVREAATTPSVPDLLHIPEFTNEPHTDLFDVYRFQEGKVTDIWLGFDVATLTQGVN